MYEFEFSKEVRIQSDQAGVGGNQTDNRGR